MALTYEAYRDLVQGLREHPEWRAELRPLVLGDEVVAIPARMDRIESRMAAVESAVAALTEAISRLEVQTARNSEAIAENSAAIDRLIIAVDTLNGRVSSIDGRLGNVEGGRLEERYFNHVRDWFVQFFERPQRVFVFELDAVRAAMKSGELTAADRSRLADTDIFVGGIDENGADLVLTGEISSTINLPDIERADRSAAILRSVGVNARGFTGGHTISVAAQPAAERLNVIVDLRRPKG